MAGSRRLATGGQTICSATVVVDTPEAQKELSSGNRASETASVSVPGMCEIIPVEWWETSSQPDKPVDDKQTEVGQTDASPTSATSCPALPTESPVPKIGRAEPGEGTIVGSPFSAKSVDSASPAIPPRVGPGEELKPAPATPAYQRLHAAHAAKLERLAQLQQQAEREAKEREQSLQRANAGRAGSGTTDSPEVLDLACNRLYKEAELRRRRLQMRQREQEEHELGSIGHSVSVCSNQPPSTCSDDEGSERCWERLYATASQRERKLEIERQKAAEEEERWLEEHSVHRAAPVEASLEACERLYADGLQQARKLEQIRAEEAEEEARRLAEESVHGRASAAAAAAEASARRLYEDSKQRALRFEERRQQEEQQRKGRSSLARSSSSSAVVNAHRFDCLYHDASRREENIRLSQARAEREELDRLKSESVHAAVQRRVRGEDQLQQVFERVSQARVPPATLRPPASWGDSSSSQSAGCANLGSGGGGAAGSGTHTAFGGAATASTSADADDDLNATASCSDDGGSLASMSTIGPPLPSTSSHGPATLAAEERRATSALQAQTQQRRTSRTPPRRPESTQAAQGGRARTPRRQSPTSTSANGLSSASGCPVQTSRRSSSSVVAAASARQPAQMSSTARQTTPRKTNAVSEGVSGGAAGVPSRGSCSRSASLGAAAVGCGTGSVSAGGSRKTPPRRQTPPQALTAPVPAIGSSDFRAAVAAALATQTSVEHNRSGESGMGGRGSTPPHSARQGHSAVSRSASRRVLTPPRSTTSVGGSVCAAGRSATPPRRAAAQSRSSAAGKSIATAATTAVAAAASAVAAVALGTSRASSTSKSPAPVRSARGGVSGAHQSARGANRSQTPTRGSAVGSGCGSARVPSGCAAPDSIALGPHAASTNVLGGFGGSSSASGCKSSGTPRRHITTSGGACDFLALAAARSTGCAGGNSCELPSSAVWVSAVNASAERACAGAAAAYPSSKRQQSSRGSSGGLTSARRGVAGAKR